MQPRHRNTLNGFHRLQIALLYVMTDLRAHPKMYPLVADRSKYKNPDEVAAAVEHALFDPQPKRRYMVVPDQHEGEITIRKQIAQLVQLNEGQPYSYDRDALVKMLDAALVGSRPKTP